MLAMSGFQIFCSLVVIFIVIWLAWKIGYKVFTWMIQGFGFVIGLIWPFALIGIIIYGIWSIITHL